MPASPAHVATKPPNINSCKRVSLQEAIRQQDISLRQASLAEGMDPSIRPFLPIVIALARIAARKLG